MTWETLDDGDVKRVMEVGDGAEAHHVQVRGNPIRYGHDVRNVVRDGTELAPGALYTLDDIRGDKLYFAAPDGTAEYRLTQATAKTEGIPPTNVEVEGDVIVEGGVMDSNLLDSGDATINPATEEKQDEMISLLEDIEENTRE